MKDSRTYALLVALALVAPVVAAEEIYSPEDDAKAQAVVRLQRAAEEEVKRAPSTGWRMEDVPTPAQLVTAQVGKDGALLLEGGQNTVPGGVHERAALAQVRPEDFHAEPVGGAVAEPVNLEDPSVLAALLFEKVATGEWVGVAILGIFGLVLLLRRVGVVRAWVASRVPWLATAKGQVVLGAVSSPLLMLANAAVAGGSAAVTVELLLKAVGIGIVGALPALLVPAKQVEEAGAKAAAGVDSKVEALAAHVAAATSDGGASHSQGGEPRA